MPDDYQPTQFEQVLDRDMELVFQAPLGAGISVTLVTEDGSTHELRAMFATPGAEPLSGVASFIYFVFTDNRHKRDLFRIGISHLLLHFG